MEKVYRLLPWLDLERAAEYLQCLTGGRVPPVCLVELVSATRLPVFVDCRGLGGTCEQTGDAVLGSGFYEVDTARFSCRLDAFDIAWTHERVYVFASQVGHSEAVTYRFETSNSTRQYLFKPADIEALAAKMNGEPAPAEPNTKPLHTSERKSAGQIIATLAAIAGLDLSAPYAADEVLRAAAATHGLELPSSPETVVKFLKDAATRAGKA